MMHNTCDIRLTIDPSSKESQAKKNFSNKFMDYHVSDVVGSQLPTNTTKHSARTKASTTLQKQPAT